MCNLFLIYEENNDNNEEIEQKCLNIKQISNKEEKIIIGEDAQQKY